MSALEVWRVLRRRWWVPVVLAVAAGAAALLYSLSLPPTYRAHAEVIVLPSRADYGLSMYLEARMRTYRAVLLAMPRTEEGLPDDLADRIHIQMATEEGRIVIEVDDHDPQQAAHWAGTLADRLEAWVDENTPPVGRDRLYVQRLFPVEVPAAPSSPRYKVNTAAGLLLGGLLGIPVAFLWDWLDDTLDDAARAQARLGITVWPELDLPSREVLRDPHGEAAAAYHRLHTYLRLPGLGGPAAEQASRWRTLAVVGAESEGLPPALLVNLGAAIAWQGHGVVLVDADLARPALHTALGLQASPGLGDLLQEGEPGFDPVQTVFAGLSLVPAGKPLPAASWAAVLHRAAEALPRLAQAAAAVLVRLPDPSGSPEGLLLAAQVDAVLLVARAGRVRSRGVFRLLEALRAAQAQVLGLVLWE